MELSKRAVAVSVIILVASGVVTQKLRSEDPESTARTHLQQDGLDYQIGRYLTTVGVSADAGQVAVPHVGSISGMPILNSESYYQSVEFAEEEDDAGVLISDNLTIVTTEQDPITGEWSDSRLGLSTSFSIQSVSARFANDFFVHGVSATGVDIIERWVVTPVRGAIRPTRAPATAIGVAYVTPSITFSVVGDQFVEPTARSSRPRVKRTEVYRGTSVGSIRSIAADPDGRYLLLLEGLAGDLYSLDILSGGGATPLFTAAQIPDLEFTSSLSAMQHESYGRVFMSAMSFVPEVLTGVSLLFDFNNDGVFDSFDSLTRSQHKLIYPLSSWTSDFTGF